MTGGAKKRDSAWDMLAIELRDILETNALTGKGPSTAKDLAESVNNLMSGESLDGFDRLVVDAQDVRNWLNGRTNPRLRLIPVLGEALGAGAKGSGGWDPLALPRAMGVVTTSVEARAVDLGLAVHRLQVRYNKLQSDLSARAQTSGAAAVVHRAIESERWAVAVWPAIEGPKDCPLHVADRLDFRRTDGAPFTRDELWVDFEDVLRGAGAFPATSYPRWTADSEGPVTVGNVPGLIGRWAVPRVGAPRASTIPEPWPGLSAITVLATTVQSWANDVASHLADVLGYGLSSTRDLSMDLFGVRDGIAADEGRRVVQRMLLGAPPRKRVWSHWTTTEPVPTDAVPTGMKAIWLRESDDLLKLEIERPIYKVGANTKTLEDLFEARDEGDRAAKALGDRAVRVDVEPKLSAADVLQRREARWSATLMAALAVTQQFLDRGDITRKGLESAWRRSQSAGQPAHAAIIQRWIAGRLGA